jgi:arylsulfatase A-like enzyme
LKKHPDLPNIVYILADDMGYGDVGHLNGECKFPTPNLDRIGREGMAFTDAHSSSSLCTPSRYSILTGRYCWRTYLKSGVLWGAGSAIIEEGRETVATLLKKAGYKTACIGKWHLGWDWAVKPGFEGKIDNETISGEEGRMDWIDFSRPIQNGPTTRGFDYYYGIIASLDMPPYVYVENETPSSEALVWQEQYGLCRPGVRQESLEWDNVLQTLTAKAVSHLESQSADQPFFLYFPLTAPHTPIEPTEEFKGKSGMNDYTDFCMEVDHRIGQLLDALDRKGLADDTIVIFATDNGAAGRWADAPRLKREFGHYCSHIYRGYKSDIWDGGHRLPFLVRWPGVVEPGSFCDQRVGLFDLFATVAEITGQDVRDNAGEDSVSLLPALKGGSIEQSIRDALVHHSENGMFALRKGKWKLCRCPASGGRGFDDIDDERAREQGLPEVQLYDMDADPGEKINLFETHPDVVADLTEALHRIVIEGRSTPGAPQQNSPDRAIEDWDQINWLPELPEEYVLSD